MQTECISGQLEFEGFDGRRVLAAFGAVTSDAGALLLRDTDRAIRLIERVAACFSDGRDPGQLIHALSTLLAVSPASQYGPARSRFAKAYQ
jgi:Transposase DDE domain group 1